MRICRLMATAGAVAACIAANSSQAQQPEYRDPSLEIKDTNAGGRFAVWIMPPRLLEATVRIDTTSENMTLSRSTPFTLNVCNKTVDFKRPTSILQANQTDGNARYDFHWHFHWVCGVPGGKPDPSSVYALPFEKGTRCKVDQGYFGTFSHQRGTTDQYALDFNQPVGTPVCAARAGVVVAVRGDSAVGGPNLELYKNAANYIVIKHADGTYGDYWHLRHFSPLVILGQRVKQGQRIGQVGATGAASCSHLHFDVSVPDKDSTKVTYPVKFATESGIKTLSEGETFTVK
jgi:murein DD-endopeptidase MepM/ murein hydrolase activator NlpD